MLNDGRLVMHIFGFLHQIPLVPPPLPQILKESQIPLLSGEVEKVEKGRK